jgi:hypothetical protein
VVRSVVDHSDEVTRLRVENERLRVENVRLQVEAVEAAQRAEREVPYVAGTALSALPPVEQGGTTGQVIGRAYDALQELRLADALPIEDRAPLAALIAVLQTKNGSDV